MRVDGVTQLLAESGFACVVGQLEQVEAGGRSGQTRRALLVARRAHVQEAFNDSAQRVACVLSAMERRNHITVLYVEHVSVSISTSVDIYNI